MSRFSSIFLCSLSGFILATIATTLLFALTDPNYTQNTGIPSVFPAALYGGPVGIVIGIVIGAVVPLSRR
jgi:hypothetical protein